MYQYRYYVEGESSSDYDSAFTMYTNIKYDLSLEGDVEALAKVCAENHYSLLARDTYKPLELWVWIDPNHRVLFDVIRR